MNKTVTINISGIIFHIEEDAYDSLSKYLVTIKGYFSNTDGGNEILADIEARIAELLQGKINNAKQVILMMDVEYVKGVMGKPEDFGAEPAEENNSGNQRFNGDEKIKRHLFRDPDDRLIGGVCSGLATYFNIETVWVRLAMFLLIFFGGISLWVYIVMWIIIPLAKTTADKFAMRGESANVNNILKSFKEEAEEVKTRMNKYGREFRNGDYNNHIRENASNALAVFFNIVTRLIGFFIFLFGAFLLLCFIVALFGLTWENSSLGISHWKAALIESPSDRALGVLAFILVFGIPVFLMIYSGIKLLFRIRYSNRWLNTSLGIIWTIGLVLGIYIAVVTFKQFNENSRLREVTELHGTGDTIRVKLNPYLNNLKALNIDNVDDLELDLGGHHNRYHFATNGEKVRVVGFVNVTVTESSTDSVELEISREARGATKKESNENAKAINYDYKISGGELVLDEIFNSDAGYRFRDQRVDIKIRLPKGKVIFFDKNLRRALENIDNTTNTWSENMVNRRWRMTDRGLECIDCNNLDDDPGDHFEHLKSKNITIDDRGIKVNGKDAEIKIDEDGIKIKTADNDTDIGDKDDKEDK